MQKIHCQACVNEKYKITTRIPVKHVCPKSDKKYVPPETQKIGDNLYYKIFIRNKLYSSKLATKYTLSVQYVNEYKVKSGTEFWTPHTKLLSEEFGGTYKYIWVKEDFYKTLAFV